MTHSVHKNAVHLLTVHLLKKTTKKLPPNFGDTKKTA